MNVSKVHKYTITLLILFLPQAGWADSGGRGKASLNRYFEIDKYHISKEVLSSFSHRCVGSEEGEDAPGADGLFQKDPDLNLLQTEKPLLVDVDSKDVYIMIQQRPPQGVCADIRQGYAKISLEKDTVRFIEPFTYEEMDAVFMANGGTKGDLIAVTRVPQILLNALVEFKSKDKQVSGYEVIVPFGKTFPYDIMPIEAAFVLPGGNNAVLVKNRSTEYWELYYFDRDMSPIDFYGKDGSPLMPRNPRPDKWKDIPEGNTLDVLFKHNEIYPFGIMKEEEYSGFLRTGGFKYFKKLVKRIHIEDYPTGGLREDMWKSSVLGYDDLLEEYHTLNGLLKETGDGDERDSLMIEERELIEELFWSGVNKTSTGILVDRDKWGNVYVHSSISPVTVVYDKSGNFAKYVYNRSDDGLACLLGENISNGCDRKAEFNELKMRLKKMMEDHISVTGRESMEAFGARWEFYDGLSVNSNGHAIRTKKTEAGRVFEIFDPNGDQIVADINLGDIDILANTGDPQERFYFVRTIDDEPENLWNQPSYEILAAKLRGDYRNQTGRP